ncbi:hypothetical protein K1719_011293 [Acacia pycnantha]|nr:hypothetical protein K1719_011293 [Acacia pycnantha]
MSDHMSKSELKDYEYKYYKGLKAGEFRLKVSDSKYSFPFCHSSSKNDYHLKEVLQHASSVCQSKSSSLRSTARHSALENYIERYLKPVPKIDCPKPDSDQLFVWPWMEFDGFNNAIDFEKSFEVDQCGKTDYIKTRNRVDRLYGWVARDDDYHAKSIIGDHLRKNGDLKPVTE